MTGSLITRNTTPLETYASLIQRTN